MPVAKPCLLCRKVTTAGSYCSACFQGRARERERRRGTMTQRGFTSQWRSIVETMKLDTPWCARCMATPETDPSVKLEGDHIVPRWKGGQSTKENCQLLCRPCHRAKGLG